MGGAHRVYTRQFREQAVGLVTREGREPTRVARELGMPHSTLLLWLQRAGWSMTDHLRSQGVAEAMAGAGREAALSISGSRS